MIPVKEIKVAQIVVIHILDLEFLKSDEILKNGKLLTVCRHMLGQHSEKISRSPLEAVRNKKLLGPFGKYFSQLHKGLEEWT